jgi:hypothetical protein
MGAVSDTVDLPHANICMNTEVIEIVSIAKLELVATQCPITD